MTEHTDIAMAPRVRCPQCGLETDWGDCEINDDGNALCPQCGAIAEDVHDSALDHPCLLYVPKSCVKPAANGKGYVVDLGTVGDAVRLIMMGAVAPDGQVAVMEVGDDRPSEVHHLQGGDLRTRGRHRPRAVRQRGQDVLLLRGVLAGTHGLRIQDVHFVPSRL